MPSKAAALGLAPDIETAQIDDKSQTDQSSALQENASQDIASLAYALWERNEDVHWDQLNRTGLKLNNK